MFNWFKKKRIKYAEYEKIGDNVYLKDGFLYFETWDNWHLKYLLSKLEYWLEISDENLVYWLHRWKLPKEWEIKVIKMNREKFKKEKQTKKEKNKRYKDKLKFIKSVK